MADLDVVFQISRLFEAPSGFGFPFAFSDSLSRVASVVKVPGVAACLVPDKARKENEIFVTSENQKIVLN